MWRGCRRCNSVGLTLVLYDSADGDGCKGSKECNTSDNEDDREKAKAKDKAFFLWLWFRLFWFNNRFYRFDDWLYRLDWLNNRLNWFYDWLNWYDWLNDRLHWFNRFNRLWNFDMG